MAARGQAAAGNPATKSVSLPLPGCGEAPDKPAPRKTPLSRTRSNAPGLAPPTPAPAPAPALGPGPDLELPAGVPKSRSVENIQGGAGAAAFAAALQPPPPQGYGLWGRPEWCGQQQQRSLVFGDQGGHVAVAQRLSDPETAPPEAANLHRKLQRQLTLNPACDPRLQQLRRGAGAAADYGWEPAHAHARPPPPPLHQHVTRNASAPDSYRPGPWNPPPAAHAPAPMGRNMFRHGSTSDPQINLCVGEAGGAGDPFDAAPVWPPPPPQQQQQAPLVWGPPAPHPHPSTEEARRVLHYHLAALFPPEQVQQAMRMFPEETSAQKICAAILAMFPGKP